MEAKTSELAGAALDWAVANANGEKLVEVEGKYFVITGFRLNPIRVPGGYTPSSDWSQGGSLIFEYRVNLKEVNEECWEAWVSGQDDRRYLPCCRGFATWRYCYGSRSNFRRDRGWQPPQLGKSRKGKSLRSSSTCSRDAIE